VLAIACIAWFVILCFVATLRANVFSVADEAGYLLPILYGFDAEKYHRWSILGAYPSYLLFFGSIRSCHRMAFLQAPRC